MTGLFLDGVGGVFITGASDPEGNHSNFNDQFFTVKRDAATGAQLWTHVYGETCVGCYDVPSDVRVDPEGNVFVIGRTSSAPFSNDVHPACARYRDRGGKGSRACSSTRESRFRRRVPLRFDAAFNLYDGGKIYNANTGAVDLKVTKWASLIGGGGGGIPVRGFGFLPGALQSATRSGPRLQVRVTLTDTSHAGESVTISVDGAPIVLTISGANAQLSTQETTTAGEHTVELTDPAGCFPPDRGRRANSAPAVYRLTGRRSMT